MLSGTPRSSVREADVRSQEPGTLPGRLAEAVRPAEGSNFCIQGLWQRPLDALVDFVKSENFNALRLSISVDVALDLDGIKATSNGLAANPQLQVPHPASENRYLHLLLYSTRGTGHSRCLRVSVLCCLLEAPLLFSSVSNVFSVLIRYLASAISPPAPHAKRMSGALERVYQQVQGLAHCCYVVSGMMQTSLHYRHTHASQQCSHAVHL